MVIGRHNDKIKALELLSLNWGKEPAHVPQ